MKNTSDSRHKHRQAGLKASATKGKEEEIRAAAMRAWTIEHGKKKRRHKSFTRGRTMPARRNGLPAFGPPEPSIQ